MVMQRGGTGFRPKPTTCVFVDGENLRLLLAAYLPAQFGDGAPLPVNLSWNTFFSYLANSVGGELLRVYWYVPEQLLPTNVGNHGDQDEKQIDDARRQLRRAQEEQDALALRWPRITFRRAGVRKYDVGAKKWKGEKGVDIAMGVDMVALSGIYEVAMVVSGDADFVPAIKAIKSLGKVVAVPRFMRGGSSKAERKTAIEGPIEGQARSVLLEADVRSDIDESHIEGILTMQPP